MSDHFWLDLVVLVLSTFVFSVLFGFSQPRKKKTSTGLYRSCAALACFSGTFDLILYEAVILNLWLRRFGLVKFGLVWINLALPWLSLVWFGLVVPQTNKQIIII